MPQIHVEAGPERIVALDIESTGTNPEKDRIVDLALATPEGRCVAFRFDPGVPIPAGATAIHGIRDEDVAGAPRFEARAAKIQAWVEGAVLLGYNSRRFDVPMLHAELRRAGQPGIDLDRVREIDVYRVWSEVEPRTLTGAARRWLAREHEGAHGAKADVQVTLDVWRQIQAEKGLAAEDAIRLTRPPNEIDRAGLFVANAEGDVLFNFGKHYGKPVRAVDASYLEWMSGDDFPASTKAVVARLLLAKR